MKIVLDTNVIIAAFASRGLSHAVFELCLKNHEAFFSEFLFSEISRNLIKRVKLSPASTEEIIQFLRVKWQTINPHVKLPKTACRDKNDIPVLELALSVPVEFIITGDDDLLSLKTIENIPIIQPREFWDRCRNEK